VRKWFLTIALSACAAWAADDPRGFQGIGWGSTPELVQQQLANPVQQNAERAAEFTPELGVMVLSGQMQIAGYPAMVHFYFFQQQFFQATVVFDFTYLAEFDHNYNVFRSVDEYYRLIRSHTLRFVGDMYELLEFRYGKRRPVFTRISPEFVFMRTDAVLNQNRWNFRYNPIEFYKKIVASAFARWDFQYTRVQFGVAISASQGRFDYVLNLSSNQISDQVIKAGKQLRSSDL